MRVPGAAAAPRLPPKTPDRGPQSVTSDDHRCAAHVQLIASARQSMATSVRSRLATRGRRFKSCQPDRSRKAVDLGILPGQRPFMLLCSILKIRPTQRQTHGVESQLKTGRLIGHGQRNGEQRIRLRHETRGQGKSFRRDRCRSTLSRTLRRGQTGDYTDRMYQALLPVLGQLDRAVWFTMV
jgi:hypothetical protein